MSLFAVLERLTGTFRLHLSPESAPTVGIMTSSGGTRRGNKKAYC